MTAQYYGSSPTDGAVPKVSSPVLPNLPIPAALSAQGLTLTNNDIPLGVLDTEGNPSQLWQQSVGPFDSEATVLADYFAALRSAEQNRPGWWSQVAPNVPFSDARPLVGARIEEYLGNVNPELAASGASITGGTISATVVVSGGNDPGTYSLDSTFQVRSGSLFVSGWSMIRR